VVPPPPPPSSSSIPTICRYPAARTLSLSLSIGVIAIVVVSGWVNKLITQFMHDAHL